MGNTLRCCAVAAVLGCLAACGEEAPAVQDAAATPTTARATLSLNGADPLVAGLIKGLLQDARDNPKSATARGQLALALDVNGFREVAIRTYGQAAALNPGAFNWPYLRALLLGSQGDYEAALDSMAAARQINPAYVPALLWQGEWLLEVNRVDAALDVYRDADKLGTEAPAAAAGIARALLRQGETEQALEVLEPACSRWSYYQLHRLLGRAYRASGRHEEAQIAFHRGNTLGQLAWLDPVQGTREKYLVSFGDRLARAERMQRSNRSDEAFELLAELRDEQPNNPRLLRAITVGNLRDGRTETALKTLDGALEQHPSSYELHKLAAAAYRMSGRTARALEHVQEAIRLVEARGEGHLLAATLHYQRLERIEALSALDRALHHGLANPHNALQLAGRIEGELGRWADAVDRYERAVQVDLSHTPSHLELAKGLAELGRFHDAQAALGFAEKLGTHARERDAAELYVAALADTRGR